MTQGQIEPLKQTGANREPQCLQALGTAAHTGGEYLETALIPALQSPQRFANSCPLQNAGILSNLPLCLF
jgi:hypothetical protein